MRETNVANMPSQNQKQRRYWIGVVSEAHVRNGEEGGFAQLCHGKAAPLRRMRQGDWLIYYSPRTEMKGGQALQSFTAIGQVVDDEVYPFKMREDFVPYRRNIRYFPCRSVKIAGLLDKLSFTKGQVGWGYSFRFGQLEVSQEDFIIIANEMLGEGWEEALPLS
ncbi:MULTISPECIES: EVE domain-containing protein [Paenibacillus]|uniref:UPF0310 protein J2TS6_45420 n=1 Tax=Paenibacillus albilobatus TaxID=2716884 RepID=A0A920CBC5_9BACL|nr:MULTISPECIES: EVE domain-containing protein [Paenibacillus]GIO33401.1 UPF0310 protein YdcG [Paenibacillus albilobatus]